MKSPNFTTREIFLKFFYNQKIDLLNSYVLLNIFYHQDIVYKYISFFGNYFIVNLSSLNIVYIKFFKITIYFLNIKRFFKSSFFLFLNL